MTVGHSQREEGGPFDLVTAILGDPNHAERCKLAQALREQFLTQPCMDDWNILWPPNSERDGVLLDSDVAEGPSVTACPTWMDVLHDPILPKLKHWWWQPGCCALPPSLRQTESEPEPCPPSGLPRPRGGGSQTSRANPAGVAAGLGRRTPPDGRLGGAGPH